MSNIFYKDCFCLKLKLRKANMYLLKLCQKDCYGSYTTDQDAPDQLTIPLDKLPWLRLQPLHYPFQPLPFLQVQPLEAYQLPILRKIN